MNLSTLFIIYAIWCLLRGIGFIFSPVKLWKTFNVNLNKHTAFPVHILEVAFIALDLLCWAARDLEDNAVLESMLLFIFSMELIQALTTLYGILRNAIAKQGWGPFALHLLFAIGFGYFLFGE